ncbi:LytTR family DNA-binding domain-containing protein [Fonticella tunisiensis]|uniref:LytTR family transcriptional regulator n=1 Tax=Fonticella tunisiensis TaxID=1096341 RepID=A0A4R7KXQ7_9CLOT|nr:LytTR family DNA-binding domain-containing protein [Fonticella tunisiensis]TDT63800.1 LytTR family transcriptional regulator [Fonticella tunisiensis]
MKIDIDIDENYKETTITIKAPEMNSEIAEILQKLKNTKSKSIIGKDNQKMYILNPQDILVFYSKGQKVMADTIDGTYEIKQKLYELEDELRGISFVRISKFAIVNINKIKNIEMFFNGSLIVNFINGRQEIISRRYVAKVKEYIGIGGK